MKLKLCWDHVYDVPLLLSLNSLLSNNEVLEEVLLFLTSVMFTMFVYMYSVYLHTYRCYEVIAEVTISLVIIATEMTTNHTHCFQMILMLYRYCFIMMIWKLPIPLALIRKFIKLVSLLFY